MVKNKTTAVMNSMESIIETRKGNIQIVRFNKPARKNAIDPDMYQKVTSILNTAAKDDNVCVTVLTGTGDYYSSGNDIKGPAIGIAATTLALCDLVIASEHSYFYTPFSNLGIVAEGCSTFTFPRLIGERKATEMLMYNYKMFAKEALECGFINDVYKPHELESKVWSKIDEVSNLPTLSISLTKKLLKGSLQEQLLKTNAEELEALGQVWMARNSSEKSKL